MTNQELVRAFATRSFIAGDSTVLPAASNGTGTMHYYSERCDVFGSELPAYLPVLYSYSEPIAAVNHSKKQYFITELKFSKVTTTHTNAAERALQLAGYKRAGRLYKMNHAVTLEYDIDLSIYR